MKFNDYVTNVKSWETGFPMIHKISEKTGDKIYIPDGVRGKFTVYPSSEILLLFPTNIKGE